MFQLASMMFLMIECLLRFQHLPSGLNIYLLMPAYMRVWPHLCWGHDLLDKYMHYPAGVCRTTLFLA